MVLLELDACDIVGMESIVAVADFTISIFAVVIGFSSVDDGRVSLICQAKPCWKIALMRGVYSLLVRLKCLSQRPEIGLP